MERTEILKNLLKAAVIGAASGVVIGAAVMAAKEILDTRYSKLIDLQIKTVNAHKTLKDAGEHHSQHGLTLISKNIDEILGFSMDKFKGDPNTVDGFLAIRSVLHNKIDTMNEEQIRGLLEVAVPVAVMRCLLAHHRIYFRLTDVSNWAAFSNKYRDAIMSA